MAALTTALNTEFTPAVGYFRVQTSNAEVRLLSSPDAGANFVLEVALNADETRLIYNPIAGVVYKFEGAAPAAPRADQ